MKKVFCLVISVTMMLAMLTGCGAKKDTVTLTIWGDADNQAILEQAFTEINEAFEKEHPDIKLDYQYSGTFDTINVAVQSDSLPDLFWVQGNKSTKMAELARNGYILNLDSYDMDSTRYSQAAIDYATVDGSVYCSYPAFLDYATIYYNKEIFDALQISKPSDFGELVAAVETLAQNGYTPIALGGKGDFDRYWLIQVMAPALCADTMEQISGHGDVDFTSMEKMFDTYREWAEKGYMGKDFTSIDAVGAQLAFTNGEAGMIVDGTWNNQMYRELNFEVGSFAFPDENGTRYAQSGESNYTTYAVAAKTEHPEEAVEYLRFLNSQQAEQIMENYVGSIPSVKDLNIRDDSVKEHSEFDVVGANIYHVLSGVADETGKPQDVFLGEVLPKLMMSEITGKEAVAMIEEEMNKSSVR
ncbi:MAG: ABC transporter substrate-binding protein [Lachnospiraceae bacterium]|nr:ABC transporter substrate-binding protein [Lachnospiraceae bacterium]